MRAKFEDVITHRSHRTYHLHTVEPNTMHNIIMSSRNFLAQLSYVNLINNALYS